MPDSSSFVIPARYNGPATTANGGYACGLIARHARARLAGRVAVTLHTPPPLETVLRTSVSARRVHVWAGEELVATASVSSTEPPTLPAVPLTEARGAESRYQGARRHPYPTCFVCGTDRGNQPGLFLRPGPVEHPLVAVACTWTPDGAASTASGVVDDEIVWGVLDCPGGWAGGDLADRPMVVSGMTAQIGSRPRIGEPCVVVGALARDSSRTATATTALYHLDGDLLARAVATWFTL